VDVDLGRDVVIHSFVTALYIPAEEICRRSEESFVTTLSRSKKEKPQHRLFRGVVFIQTCNVPHLPALGMQSSIGRVVSSLAYFRMTSCTGALSIVLVTC